MALAAESSSSVLAPVVAVDNRRNIRKSDGAKEHVQKDMP
jgi:hypothetical protein